MLTELKYLSNKTTKYLHLNWLYFGTAFEYITPTLQFEDCK